MCGGISQKDVNIIGGSFFSFMISIFQIYQFIQLSFDGEIDAIYIIVFTWVASKILAQKTMLTNFKAEYIPLYLLALIFQSEWYFNCKSETDSIIRIVIQLLINTFPTIFINIYLLSDTQRDITHGYYIAMIFINYIFIGIYIMIILTSWAQDFQAGQLIAGLASILANFVFFYLFVQSFLFNIYIGIILLSLNILVGVADYMISLKNDQPKKSELFIKIMQYAFQINCHAFSFFSKCLNNVKLEDWVPILKLGLQCFNITILMIIKLSYYPLLIQLDKAFYVILVFSLFQFYILGVNLYYKITKQNSYELTIEFTDKAISIEKQARKLLLDRFVENYKLDVKVNIERLDEINSHQFNENLKTLKNFIKEASKITLHYTTISIGDINSSFTIEMIFDQTNQQSIKIQDSLVDNPNNVQLLQNLSLLLNEKGQQKTNVITQLQDIEYLLISIQAFYEFNYIFEDNNAPIKSNFKHILTHINSSNYQVLAFYKNISQLIPINPSHLLYDLYSDRI